MRLISALLCLCFTFNVLAASGAAQELERALDEYQYALTVEWDQKDASFMTARTEAFYANVASLMEKGLTSEEIMDVVAKKSKGPKEFEALKLKVSSLAQNSSSASDLARAVTANSKDLYTTGASWDGAVILSAGFVLGFAALIAYSIMKKDNRTCVATAEMEQCGWIAQYQGGPEFYQCYNQTYCSQYAE